MNPRFLTPSQKAKISKFARRLDAVGIFGNPTALMILLWTYFEAMANESDMQKIGHTWKELGEITQKEGGTVGNAVQVLVDTGSLRRNESGKYYCTAWGRTLADVTMYIAETVAKDLDAPSELRQLAVSVVRIRNEQEELRKSMTATIVAG